MAMRSEVAQIALLEEELKLVMGAIKPEQAGLEIRDFIDEHAELDGLARTNPAYNEWIPEKEQKGKKKPKEAKRGFFG